MMELRFWRRAILLLPLHETISVEKNISKDPISSNPFASWSEIEGYWDANHEPSSVDLAHPTISPGVPPAALVNQPEPTWPVLMDGFNSFSQSPAIEPIQDPLRHLNPIPPTHSSSHQDAHIRQEQPFMKVHTTSRSNMNFQQNQIQQASTSAHSFIAPADLQHSAVQSRFSASNSNFYFGATIQDTLNELFDSHQRPSMSHIETNGDDYPVGRPIPASSATIQPGINPTDFQSHQHYNSDFSVPIYLHQEAHHSNFNIMRALLPHAVTGHLEPHTESNHQDTRVEIYDSPENDDANIPEALDKIEKKLPKRFFPLVNSAPTGLFPIDNHYYSYNFEYELVDFEPTSIDGQLVVEAVNNLKIGDKLKFFNGPGFCIPTKTLRQKNLNQKMFCLKPPDSSSTAIVFNRFFDFFYFVGRCYHENQTFPRLSEKKRRKSRYSILYSIWQNFNLDPTISKKGSKDQKLNLKILEYKEFVLAEFEETISTFEDEIFQQLRFEPKSKYHEKKIVFRKAIRVLPLYLFYVDMISAIAPAKELDKEGKLLKSQRQVAGKAFFQLLKKAILGLNQKRVNHSGIIKTEEDIVNEVIEMFQKEQFGNHSNVIPFKWRALHYWLLTSRNALAKSCRIGHNAKFKEYFNAMVFAMIQNVS